MFEISRQYHFSAAHRLEGHPKCGRMHGHNYDVIVEISSERIPPNGMLIDYGELDNHIKPLIAYLDHRFLVSEDNIEANCPYVAAAPKTDVVLLHCTASTAEMLSQYLHTRISDIDWREKGYPCIAMSFLTVTIKETAKSVASYADFMASQIT